MHRTHIHPVALVIMLAALVLLLAPTAASAFYDVPPDSPYYSQITDLTNRGIVDGYADNSFHPLNGVTRAQYAKLLCLVLELPVEESMTSPFTDLGPDSPGSLYPHEYVAAAYRAGLTNGKSATRFAPYDRIARVQATTMTMRGLMELYPPNPRMFVTYAEDFIEPLIAVWGAHTWPAMEARQYRLLDPAFDFVAYQIAVKDGKTPAYVVKGWDAMPRQEVAAFLYNAGDIFIGW